MANELQFLEHPLVCSYRELLRVERGAGPDEIRRAFRALAKVYHPDINAGPAAQQVFVQLREASKILLDPEAIRALNRDYLEGRFAKRCIPGRDLRPGTFFGHRFARRIEGGSDPECHDWSRELPRLIVDEYGNSHYERPFESHISILDHPKLDLVEVIMAGDYEVDDAERLSEAFRRKDFAALPWYMLNNEGIVRFLDGRYGEAMACYEALNRRISNNIIFLFRLGLCHEILAFKHTHAFWPGGRPWPSGRHVRAAARYYRQAIHLGENRPYMPQKCLSIRKTMADLLQAAGRNWAAWLAWKSIRDVDPESGEAILHLRQDQPRAAGLLPGGPSADTH